MVAFASGEVEAIADGVEAMKNITMATTEKVYIFGSESEKN